MMKGTISGPRPEGSNRVNRGGGWNNNARNCRSANRNRNTPANRNNNLGFRLALSSARLAGMPPADPAAVPSRYPFIMGDGQKVNSRPV